jgi:hypothetical protein
MTHTTKRFQVPSGYLVHGVQNQYEYLVLNKNEGVEKSTTVLRFAIDLSDTRLTIESVFFIPAREQNRIRSIVRHRYKCLLVVILMDKRV